MLHFTNIGPVVLFWHLARRLYLNYGHLKLSQADLVNGRMSVSQPAIRLLSVSGWETEQARSAGRRYAERLTGIAGRPFTFPAGDQ